LFQNGGEGNQDWGTGNGVNRARERVNVERRMKEGEWRELV
jgi:hypothetical protein